MAGKSFKFALDSVLKIRQHETERARHALLSAAAEREQQEQAVADARQRLDDLARNLDGSVGPMRLRQMDAFRRDAQRSCLKAERALTERQQLEAEARTLLVERRRAEEALQKLREQRREEHVREQDALDVSFLDEQAISKFARKP